MLQVQHLTSAALQTQTLLLPSGLAVKLTLYFRPLQYGWFIRNLTAGDFVLNELRVTNSPNMLHQFRNQISFGLACFSKANREPSQQQDFSSGASSLYILTADEVEQYTEFLRGG